MAGKGAVLSLAVVIAVAGCGVAASAASPPASHAASTAGWSSPPSPSVELPTESPSSAPTTSPSASPSPASTVPAISRPPAPSPSPSNPPVTCPPGPSPAPGSGPAAPQYSSGVRTEKVIALTIDDGESDAAVLADLAVLSSARVNATFFPIGANVERSPSVWRAVAAAGFPIGNHTYDHANLTCLSEAAAVADLRHANAVVRSVTGTAPLAILRPPGGATDLLVRQAAAAAGERAVVLWDVTLADTGRGGVDQLVVNGERATSGSIVLMHANGPLTQQALPLLIDHYRALGYGFVTVGQLLGVDGAVPYPTWPT